MVYRRKKAQSLIEYTLLGLLVLTGSLFGILFFSDEFSPIFEDSDVSATYTDSRLEKIIFTDELLSNNYININGEKLQAPLEETLKEKFMQGIEFELASNPGPVEETLDLINNYIDQIDLLLSSIDGTIDSELYDQFKKELTDLKSDVVDIVNAESATTESQYDITIAEFNLLQSLESTDLNNVYLEVLEAAPSGTISDILNIYQQDLNNLVTNLQYEVSGDFAENYPSESIEEITSSLESINNNLSMTDDEKQELLEDVFVFRNGSYDDLLSSSYNTSVICEQIGGIISGNTCSY